MPKVSFNQDNSNKGALAKTKEQNEKYYLKKDQLMKSMKQSIAKDCMQKQSELNKVTIGDIMKRSQNKSRSLVKPSCNSVKANNSLLYKSQSSVNLSVLTIKQIKNQSQSFLMNQPKSILKKFGLMSIAGINRNKDLAKTNRTSSALPFKIERIDNETLKKLEYIPKHKQESAQIKRPSVGFFSTDCFLEHSFKIVKDVKSSITTIYYSAISNVFNIKDVYLFGVFDGYGPNGHLVSRDFRLYFLQEMKERLRKIQRTTKAQMTPSLFYSIITQNDFHFFREMLIKCKNSTDNRIWDLHKEKSGLNISILFIIHKKLVHASVGNVKTLLMTRRLYNEREHLTIKPLCHYSVVKDSNYDQSCNSFLYPCFSYIDVKNSHQYIMQGPDSILSPYTTNMFAKFINHASLKLKENSIELLNQLLALYQKPSLYRSESNEDYFLGLILFNHKE